MAQETMSLIELAQAEIDTDQGNIEPAPQFLEQFAIAATDFEDRCRSITGQPVGEPLRTRGSGLLAFLFPKIIIAAAQSPIRARVRV